jgi:hypothetical protein
MNLQQAHIIAHELVYGFVVGPDHKIPDIQFFHTAVLHALMEAHQQGWKDHAKMVRGGERSN